MEIDKKVRFNKAPATAAAPAKKMGFRPPQQTGAFADFMRN